MATIELDYGQVVYVLDVMYTVNPGCPRTREEPGEPPCIEDVRCRLLSAKVMGPDGEVLPNSADVEPEYQREYGKAFEDGATLERVESAIWEKIGERKAVMA